MRILAGILLIVVAIVDVPVGLFYLGIGAVVTAAGEAGKGAGELIKDSVKNDSNVKAEDAAKVEKAVDDMATALSGKGWTGGTVMAYGGFLLLLTVLGIVAAIMLFLQKGKGFAMLVGVLQIAAEAIVILFNPYHRIELNALGIVAGLLAIVGALSYKAKAPAMPPPPM